MRGDLGSCWGCALVGSECSLIAINENASKEEAAEVIAWGREAIADGKGFKMAFWEDRRGP